MRLLSRAENHDLKLLVKLLKLDYRRFALAVFTGVLGLGCSIALAATAAWLIAYASSLPPVLSLSVAAVGVRAFGVGKAIFRYAERLVSHQVALKGIEQLRTHLYIKMAQSRSVKTLNLQRGDVLARLSHSLDALTEYVVKSVLPKWVTWTTNFISVLVVAILSWPVGLILAACLVLSGLVGPYLTAMSAKQTEDKLEEIENQKSILITTWLENEAEIEVSGYPQVLKQQLADLEAATTRATNRSAFINALSSGIDLLALAISVLAAVIIGIWQVKTGQISTFNLSVIVLTPLAAFEANAMLRPAALEKVHAARAAARLKELLPPIVLDTPAQTAVTNTAAKQAATNATDFSNVAIVARDLVAGWEQDKPIASHIDIEIKPGKFTVLLGPSGLGKSTLLYTLSGQIPPLKGLVNLQTSTGETPITTLSYESLSQSVIYTPEDAHIFGTSILENLRVAAGSLSRSQAENLLEKTGLASWVQALPAGLDTQIGESGATISGGERRRLLLARALATTCPLLFLDEPTEHLDTALADVIMQQLHVETRERSRGILVVTHRIHGITNADEIIVIGPKKDSKYGETAQIIARGTHAELMNSCQYYQQSFAQEIA